MAKSYKVTVFAGTKVVADMVRQVKDITWQKNTESMPAIKGGLTPATAVVLPVLTKNINRWFLASWGYWKYNGVILKNPNDIEGIPEKSEGIVFWDGISEKWSIPMVQELRVPTGVNVINPTGSQVPSEGAVARYSVAQTALFDGLNQYDYQADSDGYYLSGSDGTEQGSATSSISAYINCKGKTSIFIAERTSSNVVVFYSEDGTKLKPLMANRTPYPTFSAALNGEIGIPSGAEKFRINTRLSGVTNRENVKVTFEDTPVAKVKKELVPDTDTVLTMKGTVDSVSSTVDQLTTPKDKLTERENSGENSMTPQYFNVSPESTSRFGISISEDLSSPVRDILKYKRVFRSETVYGYNARDYYLAVGTMNRPTQIDFSFWVNKAEFLALNSTLFAFYFGGIGNFRLNTVDLLSGADQTVQITGNYPPEFTSVVCKMRKIYEKEGWIRININFSDIAWRAIFVAGQIVFYYVLLGDYAGKNLSLTDFTILFNNRASANTIYPKKSDNLKSNVLSVPLIESNLNDLTKRVDDLAQGGKTGLRIEKYNGSLYISNSHGSTKELVKKLDIGRISGTAESQPNVNYLNDYLINKGADLKVQDTLVKISTDDITPIQINGTYNSGNHGWNFAKQITKAAHGKTFADVGAVYKDTTNVLFVILRIIDANNFLICSLNQATNGYSYSFLSPIGTLTYVSNGTNNTDITGHTAAPISNMYPTISVSEKKIMLDGKTEVTLDGLYKADFVDVRDSFYLLDMASLVTAVRDNRPAGGYLDNPVFTNLAGVEKLAKHNIVYRFLSNGTTLEITTFTALKKLDFAFYGFTQSYPLVAPCTLYIPKILPITQDGKTWDFRKKENWIAPATSLFIKPPYWAIPSSPPDRLVNTNANVVYSTGYLTDRGKGLNRKDQLSDDALYLFTSTKLYLRGDSISRVMNPYESTSMVSYRSYSSPANNPAGRTNFNYFELDGSIYIYLDYHGSLEDKVIALDNWLGRKITIVEKTPNVNIGSEIVSGYIEVYSSATESDYGYIVLKLI